MNRTPEQKAAIALVESIHLERVVAATKLRKEIEEQVRDKLIDIELRESRAANDAVKTGVSVTAVGRALGTANWLSIKAILARTADQPRVEDFMPAEPVDPREARYSFNPTPNPAITNSAGIVSIDLTNATDTETAEQFAKTLKHQEWSLDAATKAKLLTVTMNVLRNPNNGALVLMNITEDQGGLNGTDFLPSYGKRHPVSAWAMQYPTEVVAWLNEHDDNEEV